MDSDVAQLVRAIHASSTKAAVYVTGGAAQVSCNLLLHCLSIGHQFLEDLNKHPVLRMMHASFLRDYLYHQCMFSWDTLLPKGPPC